MTFQYNVLSRTNLTGDIYGNELKTARVTLTAAEIKALNTTPQVLLPAPGVGFFNSIDHIVAFLNYSTAVFTGGNALRFCETNGAGTSIAEDISSAFLNSAVDIVAEVSGSVYWGQVTRLLNVPLVVVVPVADPGGATAASTLTFTIFYKTIKAI